MEHPKLILHVDVSESVLLANPSTGYGVRETLNIAIAKVALVKKNEHREDGARTHALPDSAEYCWHDGTPLSLSLRKRQNMEIPPPLFRRMLKVSTSTPPLTSVSFIGVIPKGTISYFAAFGEEASRHFTTEGPGKVYLMLAMDILREVTWPQDFPVVPGLVAEEENACYHLVVPSFFNLLVRLKMEKKEFMICLRTTGGELACVAKALDLFATGEHPLFRESVKYFETGNIRCSHRLHFLAQQRIDSKTKTEIVRITSSVRKGLFHMESQIERFLLEFDASLGMTDIDASQPMHASQPASFERVSSSQVDADFKDSTETAGSEDKAETPMPPETLTPRKVIWFTRSQSTVQPILIDGSRLSSEYGRGVCIRARNTDKDHYRSLSDDEATMMDNVLVFRPDLIQATINSDHFVQGVAACVNNLARIRHSQLMVDMCQTPLFEVSSAGENTSLAATITGSKKFPKKVA